MKEKYTRKQVFMIPGHDSMGDIIEKMDIEIKIRDINRNID